MISFLGFYIYKNNKHNNKTNIEVKQETSKNDILYKTEIENMILNILNSNGKEKLFKLSITFKSKNIELVKIFEENKSEIIDKIILTSNEFNSEELFKTEGKKLFKEKIKLSINALNLGNKENIIEDILFTEFILK